MTLPLGVRAELSSAGSGTLKFSTGVHSMKRGHETNDDYEHDHITCKTTRRTHSPAWNWRIGDGARGRDAGRARLSRDRVRTGVYPPASNLLRSLGITWNDGYREENLRPAPDLAVIGNAISRGNPELEQILDDKIPYRSMPQILEEYFLPGRNSIVIAGTHGKTTTTAMLAWIFQTAGKRPDFLIGGVAPNFGDRSYGLGGGEEFIIEGDEYDTAFFDKAPKFLHYHPDELILTSLEYDHADIYPDLASIALQFRRLVNLVPRRGQILMWGESAELREATAKAFCPVETFGLTPECDWCAGDILWHDDATEFRVAYKGSEVTRIRIPWRGGITCSMRWLPSRWPTDAASNAMPSIARWLRFRACGSAWRSRARRVAYWWSRISRTIRRRFA